MQLRAILVMGIWAGVLAAQTAAPQTTAPPVAGRPFRQAGAGKRGAAKTPVNLPPTAAVVTLDGICSEKTSPCKTVITREDLDEFARAYAPGAPETARGRVAVQYAGAMAFAGLAERQHLDQDPQLAREIALQMKLIRMRILANAYLQRKRSITVAPESEITKYYDDHKAEFEQAEVLRMAIPLVAPTEDGRRLDSKAIAGEMESLRAKVVAGGDPAELLKESFKNLHIAAPIPPMNPSTLRHTELQGDEAKVFDLNAGDVSPVLDLPASYAIYKMVSKETAALKDVHTTIEVGLEQKELEDEIRKLGGDIKAEFNLPYLNLPSQPDIFNLTAVSPQRQYQRQPRAGTAVPSGPAGQ